MINGAKHRQDQYDFYTDYFTTENGFYTAGLYLYEFNYESSSSLKAEVSSFFMHHARNTWH
jgi:hypothetical protein